MPFFLFPKPSGIASFLRKPIANHDFQVRNGNSANVRGFRYWRHKILLTAVFTTMSRELSKLHDTFKAYSSDLAVEHKALNGRHGCINTSRINISPTIIHRVSYTSDNLNEHLESLITII